VGDNLCYTEIEYAAWLNTYLASVLTFYREMVKYLNRKDVQALLGVEVPTYASCSDPVGLDFGVTLDVMKGATDYVSALLERDIRVLIYVGTYDWICNWLGNEAWTLALEWSGQAEFSSQPLTEWAVDGKRAGRTRHAKGFTFATVDAAGHMVRMVFDFKLQGGFLHLFPGTIRQAEGVPGDGKSLDFWAAFVNSHQTSV
jgi:carboxypeptidase C (cathepsin A)